MPEALFVGREHEIGIYKKFLSQETPWVLIITGLGGIGKTTLLHQLAEYTLTVPSLAKTGVVTLDFANEELRNDPLKLLDKLTQDILPYCNMQQIDIELKKALQQNFDQLALLREERVQTGVSESEDPALREIRYQMRELATEALYAQLQTLTVTRLIIMLDTCEWLTEPEGVEAGQWVLNELIPGIHNRIRQQGQQCPAVMVSRVQLRLDAINGRDQRRLALPMLGKAEVDQYLAHMGMQDSELRQRVYEVTHGLALCVSIIGDFWLNREEQKQPFTIADLPELQLQEFSEIALMRFTNERVLKQLRSPFKELTRYGVLLRSFDLPLLRVVFPELLPESESLERFNQLLRYPYIEPRGNYRYAFHELLREALAEDVQREEPEEWKCYHKHALDYLTEVLPLSPDWYYHLLAYDEEQGLANWQDAVQEARSAGKREYIGALLQAALDKALKLSPAAHAEIAYEQGRFNYYGVQWDEALKSYHEALACFEQVKDYAGQAKTLQAIGDVLRALGKPDEALASYDNALTLFQQVGDRLGEARCHQARGDVRRLRNELETALQCYEHCLNLFRQAKDKPEEAKALEAVGDVQQLRHDPDAALHSYEQALALYQGEQDRLKRARVLKAIGDVQRLRQDKTAALESYAQALAIFGELKEPTEEANVRRAIEEMQQIEQGPFSESNKYANSFDQSSTAALALPSGQTSSSAPDQQVKEYTQPSSTAIPSLNLPQRWQRVSRIKKASLFGLIPLTIVAIITLLIFPLLSHSSANNVTPTPIASPTSNASSTPIASQLPNPYSPNKGILVLNDPLINNGNGNWFEGGFSNGACVFTSGAYHVFALQPEITILCPAKTTNFRNFAYQVQVSIIKGYIGGLIFRLDTIENFYIFSITTDGHYNLSIHNGNKGFRTLIDGISPAINVGLSRSNLIAIVVSGNKLDLYINLQHIATAIDSTYSSGEIGVFAAAPQNQTEVMFNNARVWVF